MKKNNNQEQARQIVSGWPEWKRNYQLTSHVRVKVGADQANHQARGRDRGSSSDSEK